MMASVDTRADYAVLTPERVTLQYDVAGIGSRSAAALIDTAIQVAVLALLAIVVAVVAGLAGGAARGLSVPEAGTLQLAIVLALFVVCVFAVLFGYYILFEIVWNGQTPGKRVLGLRVLRENGYPIRPGDATVRNLVRVVDGPPMAAVVGLTVMLLNKQSRRLGDFAAGTIVVREGTRRGVAALTSSTSPTRAAAPGPEGADGAAGAGPLLSPADATLVRDFLVRRDRLDPDARKRLAERLADALAARYGLQARRAGSSTEVFLERLAER